MSLLRPLKMLNCNIGVTEGLLRQRYSGSTYRKVLLHPLLNFLSLLFLRSFRDSADQLYWNETRQ
jgi:hypothetical protein